MVSATGNECLVASVTMTCMYWRKAKQSLSWNLPLDLDHEEWNNFYEKGLKYVRRWGIAHNNIRHLLRAVESPLKARLEFLVDTYDLRNLINLHIPPIPLYDRKWFFKNVHDIAHAVVFVDHTKETFVSVDSSFAPKYVFKLHKTDFEEAWKFKKNATVIIYPKSYRPRIRTVPSPTLDHYRGKEGK